MEWNEKQLKILKVAENLFSQKGFEGTSVRDIAKEAQVNIAMISYYFESKENLLFNLIQYRMENSYLILKKVKDDTHFSPWEKMEQIIEYYIEMILQNRNFHAIISRQMSLIQSESLRKLLVEVKRRNSQQIFEIYKEGVDKKVFNDFEIILVISSLVGTISQIHMSRPFYSNLYNIPMENEQNYFEIMKPKLKEHLKNMLRNYLLIQPKNNPQSL